MLSISESSIIARPVRWVGAADRELKAFPDEARQEAGYALWRVQQGREPSDWKPMYAVGAGVCEIRVRTSGPRVVQHRVIYVARYAEAVYVLHAFAKKSARTSQHNIEVARARYRTLLRQRAESRGQR